MYRYQTPCVIKEMASDWVYYGACFCEITDTPDEFSIRRIEPIYNYRNNCYVY